MILERLVLRNFKRFRNAEIDFGDGITGILGNNGTGKSSLVTAIFFALYGVKATGISGDYIVSSFAGPKDKCEVVLDFRIGGDSYKIIRTFRKGKSVTHDAELYRNKKLVAKEVSPVEEAMKLAIGMGPTDFRNTIYAAQKDLLTLLDNTPAKRKEWFQKALGIDYLKTEGEKILKEQIDAKTGELQRKEGELAALGSRLSAEDPETLRKSVAVSAAAIAEHTATRDRLARQRIDLESQQRALLDRKTAYARLLQQQLAAEQELAKETAQQKALEAALALVAEEEAEYQRIEKTAGSYPEVRARLDALQKAKAEQARLAAELGFAKREIDDLASRIERQKALLAGLENDGREKDRICTSLRGCIGAGPEIADDRLETAVSFRQHEIMKRAGALAAKREQYAAEREKLRRDRETITSAGADGVCPLCRQKLGDHYGSLEAEFAKRLREIDESEAADRARQEQLTREKAALDAMVPSIATLRTIAERLKNRAAYETELVELRKRHDKKVQDAAATAGAIETLAFDEAKYRACEKEAADVQKVQLRFIELGKKIGQAVTRKQQLADLLDRIARRNEERKQVAEAITKTAFDQKALDAAEAALRAADAGLRDADVAIANATRDKKVAEEKVAAYAKAQEEIAGLKKQVAEIGDEIELLRLTRGLIAE